MQRALGAVVAAGSLFAFQALVATPASAVVSCTIAGNTLTITMTGPDTAVIGADANGVVTVGDGVTDLAVACTGGVTTTAILTTVNVTGTALDIQRFEIAMYQTVTAPATLTGGHFDEDATPSGVSWGTTNWTVTLGSTGSAAPAAGDTLAIYDFPGTTALNTTVGASGIDLTTDGDVDVSYSGLKTIEVSGSNDGTVFDSISGAGDTATGAAATTVLDASGNDGDDSIVGGAGNDILNGGGDADSVSGGAGDDTMDGGSTAPNDADADTVDYSDSTASVNVNLATGVATGQGLDLLTEFERIVGSDQNDTLTGDDQNNRITPGLGDDVVDGSTGTDTVNYSDLDEGVVIDLAAQTVTGGSGNDTLKSIEDARGSQGDDTFVDAPETDNWMRGQAGNDLFDQGEDPGGFVAENDIIDGESGLDTVDYSARTQSLTIFLNTGSSALGTEGYTCNGIADDFELSGDFGDLETDEITDTESALLGSGDDSFHGSDFNNTVNPGGGQNVLAGCRGIDDLKYAGVESAVTVNLSGGGPAGTGDSATDFENASGGDFNDTILGSDAANSLKGGKGSDRISGNAGADFTIGGPGNDSIRSGSGDDTLKGKGGRDNLRGGSGDDDLLGGKGKDTCDGGSGSDLLKSCEKKMSGKSKALTAAREAKLATLV